jgi:hypothetical protein
MFLVVVIAMPAMTEFFQREAKECRSLATRANDKNDRDYWLRLADLWEALLTRKHEGAAVETIKVRFDRPILAQGRRAA